MSPIVKFQYNSRTYYIHKYPKVGIFTVTLLLLLLMSASTGEYLQDISCLSVTTVSFTIHPCSRTGHRSAHGGPRIGAERASATAGGPGPGASVAQRLHTVPRRPASHVGDAAGFSRLRRGGPRRRVLSEGLGYRGVEEQG